MEKVVRKWSERNSQELLEFRFTANYLSNTLSLFIVFKILLHVPMTVSHAFFVVALIHGSSLKKFHSQIHRAIKQSPIIKLFLLSLYFSLLIFKSICCFMVLPFHIT